MPTPNEPKTNDPDPKTDPNTQDPGATPPVFDDWLKTQDESTKALIGNRFTALENIVGATRKERDDLSAEMKRISKDLDEGSEAKKSVDALSAKLELSERRSSFLEEAIKPETQCRNPRAAWLLAISGDHFNRSGVPDWAAIKAEAPELFGKVVANANVGDGTDDEPPKSGSMNNFIRAAAGR